MPKPRPIPNTFDGWLGDTIDGLIGHAGGRPAVAHLLGISDKTVQRKIAGAVPFTISEVERVADLVRVPAEAIVTTALTRYGDGDKEAGKARLMSEARGTTNDIDEQKKKRAAAMTPKQLEAVEKIAATRDEELLEDEPPAP